MKIALTADLHLKEISSSSELTIQQRYQVLKKIISYAEENNISHIFLCGDTFDERIRNPSNFENLCREYSSIQFYLIPGNHDYAIKNSDFIPKNIHVIEQPQWFTLSTDVEALLVPYQKKTFDEVLLECYKTHKSKKDKWILVGHGNYLSKTSIQSYLALTKNEPMYMPLSRSTVNEFNPHLVFLGHTHKPFEEDKVISVGSPYPISSNETGKRRFIVFDSDTLEYKTFYVPVFRLYLDVEFYVYPYKEKKLLIDSLKKQWNNVVSANELSPDDLDKTFLNITFSGCIQQRNLIESLIDELFNDKPVKIEKKNFDNLINANNIDSIMEVFLEKLNEKIESIPNEYKYLAELVRLKAIEIVFGKG